MNFGKHVSGSGTWTGAETWHTQLRFIISRIFAFLLSLPLERIKKYRRIHGVKVLVCYYPVFRSRKELNNHYHRALWYLPKVEGRCEEVVLIHNLQQVSEPPAARPEYMCRASLDGSHISIKTGSWLDCAKVAFRARLILVFKKDKSSIVLWFARQVGIPVVNIATGDPAAREYGQYCSLIWNYLLGRPDRLAILEASRKRFESYASALRSHDYEQACVFGTGPSLEVVTEFEFGDTFTVICNATVANEKIMQHVRPDFVAAADVVSHLGVSLQAEEFRKQLITAMEQHDFHFCTTAQFGYLLIIHHPEIRDRVLLIDQARFSPNYNLLASFAAPRLDSVMNIIMLPLAATFSNEIWLLGADGKSDVRSNEDFWAHAKDTGYVDHLVSAGHRCHPTFDVNRQKVTHDRYNDSISKTILQGEKQYGKIYRTLSPSNTPVLKERSVPQGWLDKTTSGPPYSLTELTKKLRSKVGDTGSKVDGGQAMTALGLDPTLPTRLAISKCILDPDHVLIVSGWALSPYPIDHIRISMDGNTLGLAVRDRPRGDVLKSHPDYHEENAGYEIIVQAELGPESKALVKAEVISRGRSLRAEMRDLEIPV